MLEIHHSLNPKTSTDVEWKPRRFVAVWPILISAMSHLAILVLLAFLSFSVVMASHENPHLIDTMLEDVGEESEIDLTPITPATQPTDKPVETQTNDNTSSPQNVVTQLAQKPVVTTTVSVQNSKTYAISDTLDKLNLSSPMEYNMRDMNTLMMLAGEGIGLGDEGDGQGGGKKFFEEDKESKNVIYIVDSSTSMNHPHLSVARTRFGRVKIELLRSIHSLSENQKFMVIFFNDHAIPMPAGDYISRSSDSLKSQYEWIAKHYADGDTNPVEALQLALMKNPDVVYFLTDGKVGPTLPDKINKLNRSRTKIHTVCIGNEQSQWLMKKISKVTGGTYTFVP